MRAMLRWGSALLVLTLAGQSALARSLDDALALIGAPLMGHIAQALKKGDMPQGAQIGIAHFADAAGVSCEPLAGILKDGIRGSLTQYASMQAHDVALVENPELGKVAAMVSGRWRVDAAGDIQLTVRLGDVRDMSFKNIGIEKITFSRDALSADGRRCLLAYQPVERSVELKSPVSVRSSPTPMGTRVDRLAPGAKIWVSARVTSTGGENWYVVRLSDDDTMPVGMRKRQGFVYDMVIPFDPNRDIDVHELDATFVTTKMAKVRIYPTARSKELDRLEEGAEVQVTGKIVDKNWYRVVWRDDDAYVYGDFVKEIDAAEITAWRAVRDATDPNLVQAFITNWPDGYFAPRAAALLRTLGPPLEVKIWASEKTYREGEKILISLKGNKDFFAVVVYRDADGNLIKLLPNKFRSDASFEARRTYAIPDTKDRFDLEVSPPFGAESLHVFAASEALPKVSGDDIGGGLVLLRQSLGQVKTLLRGARVVGHETTGADKPIVVIESIFRLQTRR